MGQGNCRRRQSLRLYLACASPTPTALRLPLGEIDIVKGDSVMAAT